MKPVVIDNFIDNQSFQNLQNIILGDNFSWFFNDGIDYKNEEGDKFQFTHIFYKENVGWSARHEILNRILNRIRPKEIFRIKTNLLTRTPEIIENEFHQDMGRVYNKDGGVSVLSEEQLKQYTTSIFYVNTNNGYTEFEDGTKVESVANRMITFSSNLKHRGTSCTNKKVRVVINFNYLT